MVNAEHEKKLEEYRKKKAEREKNGIAQEPPLPIGNKEKEEPVKKKRTTRRRKKKTTVDSESVEKLLLTVTGMVATRPHMQHWAMTKTEAKSIAEPLTEILDKYDLASGIAENSSEIALVVASVSFVAPRLMVTMTQRKEKKNDGMGGKSTTGSTGKKLDETRKSTGNRKDGNGKIGNTARAESSYGEYGVFGSPL